MDCLHTESVDKLFEATCFITGSLKFLLNITAKLYEYRLEDWS